MQNEAKSTVSHPELILIFVVVVCARGTTTTCPCRSRQYTIVVSNNIKQQGAAKEAASEITAGAF